MAGNLVEAIFRQVPQDILHPNGLVNYIKYDHQGDLSPRAELCGAGLSDARVGQKNLIFPPFPFISAHWHLPAGNRSRVRVRKNISRHFLSFPPIGICQQVADTDVGTAGLQRAW